MRNIILALIGLVLSDNAFSASVWKVEKEESHLYIAGTIHALSESEYPLPAAFTDAYEQADTIYFETDLNNIQSAEFRTTMLQAMTYKAGKSLADDLEEDTLTALKTVLSNRGVPFDKVSNLKASLMGLTLTSLEMQRLGISGKGVDKHFHEMSVSDNKEIGWLESLDVQIATLASFGDGHEDEYIRYVLNSIENQKDTMDAMQKHWRNANTSELYKTFLVPMKQNFPDVYNKAVINRNNAWYSQIEDMLKDDTPEVVFVGVLHLAGTDSLLKMLVNAGYTVTKL